MPAKSSGLAGGGRMSVDLAWERWCEESVYAQLEFARQKVERALQLLSSSPDISDLAAAGDLLPVLWDKLESIRACLAARITEQLRAQQGVISRAAA